MSALIKLLRDAERERDEARAQLAMYASLGLIPQPNPDDDLLAVIRELWERGKHTPESAAAQIQALIDAKVAREARPKEDWNALRAEAERDDARADFNSLEDDAAKVVLAYRNGDKSELDEAVENLASNGRPQWWQKAKPIGLRGESDD
jgi:hypothetical protein